MGDPWHNADVLSWVSERKDALQIQNCMGYALELIYNIQSRCRFQFQDWVIGYLTTHLLHAFHQLDNKITRAYSDKALIWTLKRCKICSAHLGPFKTFEHRFGLQEKPIWPDLLDS